MTVLPEPVPPSLARIWAGLTEVQRELLHDRIVLNDRSAEFICFALQNVGHRVSPSTIRSYRRALARQKGEAA